MHGHSGSPIRHAKKSRIQCEFVESIRGYALECTYCGNVWAVIPSKRIPVFPPGFGRCPDGQECKRFAIPESEQEIEPLPRRQIMFAGKSFEQLDNPKSTRDRAMLWLIELPTGELITVAERFPINHLEARKRARVHLERVRLPRGTKLLRQAK